MNNMSDDYRFVLNTGKIMSTAVTRVLEVAFVKSTRAVLCVATSPNKLRKPKRCPAVTDKLLLLSARTLAAMIRKKEVTSETVIKSYISRIKEVNPVLNAVVEDRFDLAIQDAKQVDTMLSTTNLTVAELELKYPLLGLPLTVKETIAVEGCSHSSGFVFPVPRRATADATIVRLCKEAGAIPIALTNTPELGLSYETYNNVTGLTKNPYDTRRTVGGSSGGEGALLGSAASVIGLASDLFGSIRIPGSFCGVWGHKPSSHAVSLDGHYPSCESSTVWQSSFAMGPMTRYASDLSLLMQVIEKKPAPNAANGNRVKMEDIIIYHTEGKIGSLLSRTTDQEITNAVQNLISRLSKSYNKKVKINNIERCKEYMLPLLIKMIHETEMPTKDSKDVKKILQFLIGQSKHTLMFILSIITKRMSLQFIQSRIPNCLVEIETMKTEICQILGQNGVLILPTHPTPAYLHNTFFGRFDDFVRVGMFNILGLPVTQCPIGLTSNGLPFGVQVVGIPGNDSLTIAVAEEIEKEFGGWKPPQFS